MCMKNRMEGGQESIGDRSHHCIDENAKRGGDKQGYAIEIGIGNRSAELTDGQQGEQDGDKQCVWFHMAIL
ncbi:hypothetical protein SDC9_56046 [bioreactor metagenome]|uniref:Uncharacterized protein n=1 Tax=bioreactor metagenome TaxID=1076179 RepID=A0A644X6E2_9ZZZZ